MYRSQRFLIGKKIFWLSKALWKWPWNLVSAVQKEALTHTASTRTFLVSKAVHLGVVSSALGRTTASSSLSTQESSSNQPSRRIPVAFPSQSPHPTPTTPPVMISLLLMLSAGTKHHVCEHVKILSFIMLQTSGRKENHSSLFY